MMGHMPIMAACGRGAAGRVPGPAPGAHPSRPGRLPPRTLCGVRPFAPGRSSLAAPSGLPPLFLPAPGPFPRRGPCPCAGPLRGGPPAPCAAPCAPAPRLVRSAACAPLRGSAGSRWPRCAWLALRPLRAPCSVALALLRARSCASRVPRRVPPGPCPFGASGGSLVGLVASSAARSCPGGLRGPSARFWWPPAPGAFRWRAAACRRLRCLGGCGVLPASPPPLPPRWGSRGARGLRPWGLPPPPFGLPLLSGVLPLPFPPLSHCPPRLKASLRRASHGLDPLRAFLSGGLDILTRLWYICLARPVPLLRGLPHLGYPWTAGKPLGLSTRRFFYALWPVRCPCKIAPLIFQRSTEFTGPGTAFSLE